MVATSNRPIEALPPALKDRFPVHIHVDEVAPGALAALPPDLQSIAKTTVMLDEDQRRIGMRSWLEFGRLRLKIGAPMAGKAVFGDRHRDIMAGLGIGKV